MQVIERNLPALIRDAVKAGRGVRLSAEECRALAMHPLLATLLPEHFTTEWRPVPGFERYEVSVRGHVRRGHKLLKQMEAKSGHRHVTLYSTEGVQWRAGVHKLVALTFIGPQPAGCPFVCHKNGRAFENNPENLYWGSREDNTADMIRHRKQPWRIRGMQHIETGL